MLKCSNCKSIVPRDSVENHIREEVGYAPIVCLLCPFRTRFFDEATAAAHADARHEGILPSFAEKTVPEMERKIKELLAKCEVADLESYGPVKDAEKAGIKDVHYSVSESPTPQPGHSSQRQPYEANRKLDDSSSEISLVTSDSSKLGEDSNTSQSVEPTRKSLCSTPKYGEKNSSNARFAFDHSIDISALLSDHSSSNSEPSLPSLHSSSFDLHTEEHKKDYPKTSNKEQDYDQSKIDGILETGEQDENKMVAQNETEEIDALPEPLNEEEPVELPMVPVLPKGRHECTRCHRTYHLSGLPDHVSTQHFGRPMYQCKLCPFVSNLYYNDLSQRDHVKRRHQTREHLWVLYFTDMRPGIAADFTVCFESCFPTLKLPAPIKHTVPDALAVAQSGEGGNTAFVPTGVPLSTCLECSKTVTVTEEKNHAMLCHMDGAVTFQCRLCSHTSPYWSGEFKQLTKHVAYAHPGQGHWKKVVVDNRKELGPTVTALEARLYTSVKSEPPDKKLKLETAFTNERAEQKSELRSQNHETGSEVTHLEKSEALLPKNKLCMKCNKTVLRGNIVRHTQTHLSEKVGSSGFCQVCAKSFYWSMENSRRTPFSKHAASHNKSVEAVIQRSLNYSCVALELGRLSLYCFPGVSNSYTALVQFPVSLNPTEYCSLNKKEKIDYRRSRELLSTLTMVETLDELPKILLVKPKPVLSTNRRAVTSRIKIPCPECGKKVKPKGFRKFHAWEHWDDREKLVIRCRLCDWRPGGNIRYRNQSLRYHHLPTAHGLTKVTPHEAVQKGWIEDQVTEHKGIIALGFRLFPSYKIQMRDKKSPCQFFTQLTLARLQKKAEIERLEFEGTEAPAEEFVRNKCLVAWRKMGRKDQEKFRNMQNEEQENNYQDVD